MVSLENHVTLSDMGGNRAAYDREYWNSPPMDQKLKGANV